MESANEIQCPNCGSNDAVQQPNSPGMFRCNYCRTLFAPRFDMRPHVPQRRQPPPPQSPPPAHHAPINQGSSWDGALAGRDTASRYLIYGFLAFFFCGAISPIVWYVGYREAKRKGEDPGALLVLSLLFGVPIIGFGLLIVVMMIASALK